MAPQSEVSSGGAIVVLNDKVWIAQETFFFGEILARIFPLRKG